MEGKRTCGNCQLGQECHYAFVGFEQQIPELVLIHCQFDDEFYHYPDSPCWFPEKVRYTISSNEGGA